MKNCISLLLFIVIKAGLFAQTSVTAPECIAPFYHGVASGDPLNDRVIIWTRITPTDFSMPVPVSYRMATDTAMNNIVAQGSMLTNASRDYTVKFDVVGLSPDTYYYYEFNSGSDYSQRGRTKTAPVGDVDSLRFAVVSCANLESGYFNSYRVLNERNDFEAVLMLGDYMYEYETGGYSPNPNVDRAFEPETEIINLDDYRLRYSIYHMDESLRKLHQNFPWICVWDDHESANDSYKDGAENHNNGEGTWEERKSYAQQAYFEWLPIREKAPGNHEIFRTFNYGNLLDLMMVDTRLHGRDEQEGATSSNLNNPNRTLLGDDQFQWLKDELVQSTAQWKVLGNQVVMAKLTVFGVPVNTDAWDGYPVHRQSLFDHLVMNNIENFVVLTGDVHTSWAFDLKNGSNNVGIEFVTPSVTSPGADINVGSVLYLENPHLKYVEMTKKGFVMLDVNTSRVQADWFYVNTIDQISSEYHWAQSQFSHSGMSQLNSTNTAASPASKYDVVHAPQCPRIIINNAAINEIAPKIISIYPNPTVDKLIVHFSDAELKNLTISISDMAGKNLIMQDLPTSFPVYSVDVSELATGAYYLNIMDESGKSTSVKFIKE